MIKIGNKIIRASVKDILEDIQKETKHEYLKTIKETSNYFMVTCPFHKNHQENKPSCGVFKKDTNSFKEGDFHCFTCNESGSIQKFVGKCFERDELFGARWLLDNYNITYEEQIDYLEPIVLDDKKKEILDESILNEYAYFHPYMFQRGLDENTIIKFKIGYNQKNNSITFPIWDEHDNLVGITERYIDRKQFNIPSNLSKPIYLLNYIIKENIDTVWVVESQINALNCWRRGRPAIALLGTGSSTQYDILKKSGIRTYFLAFDGDEAGDRGIKKFLKAMPNDLIINIVNIPRGKDVSDLTDDEFNKLTFYTA